MSAPPGTAAAVGAFAASSAAASPSPSAPPSSDVPEWLRDTQAEADRQNTAQAAKNSAADNGAFADSAALASAAALATAHEPATSPQPTLSEIKLTGDDYDYSDIGGQVTDEMKAELEALAGSVESVDDEVALARRLLGLEVAQEVASSVPMAEAPVVETAAAPVAYAPVRDATSVPPAQASTSHIGAAAAVGAAASAAAKMQADASAAPIQPTDQIETPIAPQPALSEIKLTGDDYDYGDIGGQVTPEMQAELEAQAGSVESVDDEVALARRLLGLEVAQEIAEANAPVAEMPAAQAAFAPIEDTTSAPAAQESTQPLEAMTPVTAALESGVPAEQATPEAEQESIPEWLTAFAAASTAAVVHKARSDIDEQAQAALTTEPATATAESVAEQESAALPEFESETSAAGVDSALSEPATTEPHPGKIAGAAVAAVALTGDEPPDVAAVSPGGDLQPTAAAPPEGAPAQLPMSEKPVPALESGDVPDWVRELAPADVRAADAVAAGSAQDTMPDWLRAAAPVGAVIGASALLARLPDLDEQERGDLPEWLREPVEPPGAAQVEDTATVPSDAAPLELPSWFAESAAATAARDPFEVVETIGPLAGVRGILPLALAITEPHTLSMPIPVRSDGGRIFQTLLAEPLASTARVPSESQARRLLTTNHLLYLLILLAAAIPLFLPLDQAGLGINATQSATAGFYDQLQAVPSNGTVLMAFDYNPGQAVELDPAARAIVNDVAARSASVIALSSNPNGAAIAQGILQGAQEATPGFNFVNVGYIPGNDAGLRVLATGWLPASRLDVQGVPWGSSPLASSVRGMDELTLSIVLAGDDPSLRAWMEQVEPRITSPMIAATTAALEPQARNYVNSNQLQASLRGLTGAAELELLSNKTGQAVKTVDALSVVSLVLAGIIVAANILYLIKRGQTGNR